MDGYNAKNHQLQGGDAWEVGGTLDVVSGGALKIAGSAITSDAAELNKLDGVTTTTAELNTLADEITQMTTTGVPASGTNGVQFVFKNAAGAAVGSRRGMLMILTDVNGDVVTAGTSVAALVNGKVVTLVIGQVALVECSAAGLLGVTLTHAAGTYYLTFVLPNGKLLTSSPLVVNA